MDLKIPDRQFVCIDYPCIVKSVPKMLKTLGGEKGVTKTYLGKNKGKGLELRFRPDDIYCKPACADLQAFTGLLVKVRRRRRVQNTEPSTIPVQDHSLSSFAQHNDASVTLPSEKSGTSGDQEFEGEIVGIVDTLYKFNSMNDYQYLPMIREKDGQGYRSLLSELRMDKLPTPSWLDEPAHLHLPPPMFTKCGRPVMYCYKEPTIAREFDSTTQSSNVIGVARKPRPAFTINVKFSDPTVPEAPLPESLEKLAQHRISTESINQMKEMFDKRPVWTLIAIVGHLPHLTKDEIKLTLPCISYYFLSGPWHAMWVRFGYDPRKDPSSKIYQNVDFRCRITTPGVHSVIPAKRSSVKSFLPNAVTKAHSQTSLIQRELFLKHEQEWANTDYEESKAQQQRAKRTLYKYYPGVVPPYRITPYQFCDVDEPEVQRLVHMNDGKEKECSMKEGWCSSGVIDKTREILNSQVSQVVKNTGTGALQTEGTTLEDTLNYSHSSSDNDDEIAPEEVTLGDINYGTSSSDEEMGEEDDEEEL